jgi:hypothetical protein
MKYIVFRKKGPRQPEEFIGNVLGHERTQKSSLWKINSDQLVIAS